jgi:hypothetical protein
MTARKTERFRKPRTFNTGQIKRFKTAEGNRRKPKRSLEKSFDDIEKQIEAKT